jgi:pimeloyl-ACP methyl ester carboxylesterase
MARLSRQTREIINIIIFLIVLGALLFFYVIYPLGATADTFGRFEGEEVSIDSLPPNNPEPFIQAGFVAPDTFRVESDGLTRIAAVYLMPPADTAADTARGLVMLLPGFNQNRDSLIPLARMFVDSGYAVVTYDPRATGLSTGRYHDGGTYEANDLQEVIAYLDLRNRIIHPLSVVGFDLDADAAIIASQGESRIDRVVAINPFLTTNRLLDVLKRRNNIMWFPFYRTIMWWWYGIRSGYVTTKRTIDQIQPVVKPTLLIISDRSIGADAIDKFVAISDTSLLTTKIYPDTTITLYDDILKFITR